MAARTIEVPSFDFSSFYYPQILEALIARKRIDVPELTDESDFEPFIQLLRATALVGHLNNVLLDVVANESTLPTAQLPETVRNMLRLIDYEMSSATPSATDLVYELSQPTAAPLEVVPVEAQSATQAEGTIASVFFESLSGLVVDRTDEFSSVLSLDASSGVFTDRTSDANAGTPFVAWAAPDGEDSLYFGHANAMWDVMDLDVTVAAAGITGIWEFYDGDFGDKAPTDVTNIGGGSLQFDLTSLLGALDRRNTTVRVALNESGTFVDVASTWNGTTNIATTSLLGQTSPSVEVDDYTIGTDWTEFSLAEGLTFTDGTDGLMQAGEVEYSLPQTEIHNWRVSQVNAVSAFWIRFRIITVAGPTSPTIGLSRMDTGKQYVTSPVTQGRTVADNPLGSSTGAPSQRFESSRDHFIDNSQIVTVDSETWIRVTNFLGSGPQDKHYVVELGEDDRATIAFGDGVSGRIPPVGQGNISAEYRFNAEADGNVGANTIVVDKTGLTFVNSVYNPRQAGGWSQAEGATEASLERAKLEGPATLRVKEVALNGDDAEVLTKSFVASDGTSPFSRSTHIEEGFGPKTLELITVASGGVVPTQDQLDELALYFNGDQFAEPPATKHYVANQQVVPVSFSPRTVDVTATVRAPAAVTVAQIQNGLSQVLQPEAVKEDGVTFEWNFGGVIDDSRLSHEIFKVDSRIEGVTITVPSGDIVLGKRELPVAGTFLITIVEP